MHYIQCSLFIPKIWRLGRTGISCKPCQAYLEEEAHLDMRVNKRLLAGEVSQARSFNKQLSSTRILSSASPVEAPATRFSSHMVISIQHNPIKVWYILQSKAFSRCFELFRYDFLCINACNPFSMWTCNRSPQVANSCKCDYREHQSAIKWQEYTIDRAAAPPFSTVTSRCWVPPQRTETGVRVWNPCQLSCSNMAAIWWTTYEWCDVAFARQEAHSLDCHMQATRRGWALMFSYCPAPTLAKLDSRKYSGYISYAFTICSLFSLLCRRRRHVETSTFEIFFVFFWIICIFGLFFVAVLKNTLRPGKKKHRANQVIKWHNMYLLVQTCIQ